MNYVKNIFNYLNSDFFKPLTSKYHKEYADCIYLIHHTFKNELTYGVNREVVVSTLEEYFNEDYHDMIFDNDEILKSPRAQANAVINSLKKCGWLEYETNINKETFVVLNEYALTIIDSFNKITSDDETEYQGIITQIYSNLSNQDLYAKPYEYILKGVKESTDRLIHELKKLNLSIKKHVEKLADKKEIGQVLETLIRYQNEIGSKAYMRLKTSENIFYFRSNIIEKLDEIQSSSKLVDLATKGYMEIENQSDYDTAYDEVIILINNIKSAFNRLNFIIAEIDQRHHNCIKSATLRAKFLHTTGSNLEGKLLDILRKCVIDINENNNLYETIEDDFIDIFSLYQQSYLDQESLQTIKVRRKAGVINELDLDNVMSESDREKFLIELKLKNDSIYTRKKINEYVKELLKDTNQVQASSLNIETKKDLVRLIYISLEGNNRSNCYFVSRSKEKVKVGNYAFFDFTIIKR